MVGCWVVVVVVFGVYVKQCLMVFSQMRKHVFVNSHLVSVFSRIHN